MQQQSPHKKSRWPVYLVILLFIVVSVVFMIEFVVSTESEIVAKAVATAESSTDNYAATVAALLENADPANGAALVEFHGCIACHRIGAANNIAPAFEGIAERAATRRPPLTAAAYLYEAITNPAAYVVEDYNLSMPQDYAQRLSEREIGDIIAYLLTADAH